MSEVRVALLLLVDESLESVQLAICVQDQVPLHARLVAGHVSAVLASWLCLEVDLAVALVSGLASAGFLVFQVAIAIQSTHSQQQVGQIT